MRAPSKRLRWQDFRPEQQRAIVIVTVVTGALQAVMLWDLWRRPAEQVRGPKRAWVVASFVRPFGQVAYLRWGRKPASGEATRVDVTTP